MDLNTKCQQVRLLLSQIEHILNLENEINWIRPFRGMLQIMNDASVEQQDKFRALEEVWYILRNIYRGAGSFSDYYIERANIGEQIKANEEFDRLTTELWEIFCNDIPNL
jgi:hypothetical protein